MMLFPKEPVGVISDDAINFCDGCSRCVKMGHATRADGKSVLLLSRSSCEFSVPERRNLFRLSLSANAGSWIDHHPLASVVVIRKPAASQLAGKSRAILTNWPQIEQHVFTRRRFPDPQGNQGLKLENTVYCSCLIDVTRVGLLVNPSLPLNTFRKSAGCPSAQTLLEFAQSGSLSKRRQFTAAHLQQCEFCCAELQLLKRFPFQPEEVQFAEIPPELRLLAESVLERSAAQPFGFADIRHTLN